MKVTRDKIANVAPVGTTKSVLYFVLPAEQVKNMSFVL